VVGGGNTAVEEALYLANISRHVQLVHRATSPCRENHAGQADEARRRRQDRPRLDAVVDEVLGDNTGVTASACSSSRETASATSWPRGCSWR